MIGPYYAQDSMYWQPEYKLIEQFNEGQAEQGLPLLRLKNALCQNCDGEGTMVNRSIDGQGLDPNDPDLDEDFWETYHSGGYDVRCDECDARGVVRVVDGDLTDPAVFKDWEQYRQSNWESVQEHLSEMRMGA